VSVRVTVQVDEIPEVQVDPAGNVAAGGWIFPFVVTAEDVAAFAAAKTYFEQHPEAVADLHEDDVDPHDEKFLDAIDYNEEVAAT
jgi:hypothetical protein